MNWISIALAALSGALAFGIATLAVRNPKEKRVAFILTGVLAFVVLETMTVWFLLPRIEAWDNARRIESAFQGIPAFQAIKEHDPKTYQAMVTELATALNNGATEAEILAKVRSHIGRVIQTRLPSASDEAVVDYMKIMLAEMKELDSRGNDLCYRFLFPEESGPIDGRKYFSAEMQQADLAALALVIKTSAENPQPPPAEAEVSRQLSPIYQELGKEYGDDLLMLQHPTAPNVDKNKICTMAMSLYSKILELSENESGKILRFMLARSS